jgi:tRNA pseudouridine32 synthase/23S rRNA pseudouridine746 synthase
MLDQRILFIDAEAMVIDKPAGLPVDTPRKGGDSVAKRLNELKQGFQRPPTPMHRLDQDTSGCLLLARSPKARSSLQKAFEAHRIEKYYLALVDGEIERDEGTIDVPLAKKSSAEAGWRMVADPKGDKAITHWRKVFAQGGRTLVEFRPVTGRTHQLRVHAREAFGRGIVGDRVYGVPGGQMLLHASRLVVPREKKAAIDVSAPLPDYFEDFTQ